MIGRGFHGNSPYRKARLDRIYPQIDPVRFNKKKFGSEI
jgi:hypothetical protein